MATVVFGVIFLWMFREQIRQLLGRATSLSKGSIRFRKDGARAHEDAQSSAGKPDALAEFLEEFESTLFRDTESEIEKDLQARGFTDPDDVRKVLLKTLARAAIFGDFRVIQLVIFASQFNALRFLNVQHIPTTKATLKANFYDHAVASFPMTYENRKFDEWLDYLKGQELVIGTEEGISLSVRGREYLKWTVENGFPEPWYG